MNKSCRGSLVAKPKSLVAEICGLAAFFINHIINHMLTKDQKKKQIELGVDLIKKSKTLVFADFTGVSTASLRRIKSEVKKTGAVFRVIKKRLLKLAFKESGIDFDPLQFGAQIGTFFVPEDLSSVATTIYKFAKDLAKEKKNFQILGAYDLAAKVPVSVEEFNTVAKLPTREVLLGMVLGAVTGPLRAFMYVIDQLSRRPASEVPAGEKVAT